MHLASIHSLQISKIDNAERVKYLATHLVTRDWNEEELCFIGIFGSEATLSDILEEIALTRILSGELPRRLVERFGITIRVYINLELLLHFLKVQLEHARRVVRVRKLFFSTLFLFLAPRHIVQLRHRKLGNLNQKKGNQETGEKLKITKWGGRKMRNWYLGWWVWVFEREEGETEKSEDCEEEKWESQREETLLPWRHHCWIWFWSQRIEVWRIGLEWRRE